MTIYALSSGPGLSGVAVIRISGEETPSILKLLTKKDLPRPRVATLSKIIDSNNSELIDEALVLWFPGPNSYTGEDMAEFHVHGSMAVIKAIHKALEDTKKCRIAEPGEFTKKAFQNGKINLLKAESIADLISSETEIQRKQAIATMSGKTSRIFNEMRDLLLKSLSNIEAKIDFPEEDLSEEVLSNTKENIDRVIQKIQKILNDQKVGERIREGFKIAIVGPTNAGKSSLLNYLSKREAAIVSETAGTTRDEELERELNREFRSDPARRGLGGLLGHRQCPRSIEIHRGAGAVQCDHCVHPVAVDLAAVGQRVQPDRKDRSRVRVVHDTYLRVAHHFMSAGAAPSSRLSRTRGATNCSRSKWL